MEAIKVIKIGGNIIDDNKSLNKFLSQFAQLSGPKILVHGGGKLASQLAERLNIPVNIQDGRRITDDATLDIISMVYAGKINKSIVASLQAKGSNALGLTGADANTIVSNKRPIKAIDYGYVGDIDMVNTNTIEMLISCNITPVFCAITHDKKGQLLNTNADTIAAELAIAFAKKYNVELYYCFEKKGVLRDINQPDSVIEHINMETLETLINNGIITDGMLPKLNNCFHAINNNVSKVCIGKYNQILAQKNGFTTITK